MLYPQSARANNMPTWSMFKIRLVIVVADPDPAVGHVVLGIALIDVADIAKSMHPRLAVANRDVGLRQLGVWPGSPQKAVGSISSTLARRLSPICGNSEQDERDNP